MLDGIIIYDPATGKKQIIDKSNGLTNNIVVSLLEDNDGDIWAGTFYGLTVLSQEGAVIGRLFEEDGLSNNECNRWSAMKMKDGRLCFGSVGGVTIIDPKLWKSSAVGQVSPGIFLTELYTEGEGATSERKDYLWLMGQLYQPEWTCQYRYLEYGDSDRYTQYVSYSQCFQPAYRHLEHGGSDPCEYRVFRRHFLQSAHRHMEHGGDDHYGWHVFWRNCLQPAPQHLDFERSSQSDHDAEQLRHGLQ